MSLTNIKELYVEELRDLYNAETQLTKALPQLAEASSEPQLKTAFTQHLKQTEGHIERLTQIFDALDEKPTGKVCKAMKGLVAEGEEAIEEDAEPEIKDAALIAAAQRVEHYEIAGYGSAREFAKLLGEDDAVQLLEETLKEEGNADKLLNKIATTTVNPKALGGQNGNDSGHSKRKQSTSEGQSRDNATVGTTSAGNGQSRSKAAAGTSSTGGSRSGVSVE